MSNSDPASPAPTTSATLRKLFMTLFLRGRSSRGIQKQTAPKSVARKLLVTILFYVLFGCVTLGLRGQPVFALSVFLHAMTFVFLGMFVASAGGEVLFNKDEADILLHRPITIRALLWAKIRMLVEISLWLAAAFNLAGFYMGTRSPDGGWMFLPVHVVSTTLEAFFCTGCVIMAYQLCLRYFGRERLDGLMTASQVIVSIAAVMLGQIVPQLMFRLGNVIHFNATSWWIALLPPAWFAGFDDALAGSGAKGSWLLAAFAIVATVVVSWFAIDKLAADYESGLQRLSETTTRKSRSRAGRRWIDRLIDVPPLSWWLRDPVSRASFLLTAAYLVRDRDIKLRVYPAIAPILILPLLGLIQQMGRGSNPAGEFQTGFAGGFLGIVPMFALTLLQYSQQWQASDIFRAAPMAGPMAICHGARRAVLLFLGIPTIIVLAGLVWLVHRDAMHLLILLPGVIAMPLFGLIATATGNAIPLSLPTEAARSANRGLVMLGAGAVAMVLGGAASAALSMGFFWWLIDFELIAATTVYLILRFTITDIRWPSME